MGFWDCLFSFWKWWSDSKDVKIGFVGFIFLCASQPNIKTRHVLLDFDLCFSEDRYGWTLGTICLVRDHVKK